MTDAPLPAKPITQARDRTIAVLCEHFALDNIDSHELEVRIDRAHQAKSMQDLEVLTADLPVEEAAPNVALTDPNLERDRPAHQAIIAIMGGSERRGHWTPAARVVVVTLMGGAELDFRDAQLPPGVTDVHIVALMGGAEIIVPPGLRVESNGFALMGGWGHSEQDNEQHAYDPDAPILRINGIALMGGVDITVRQPGESARDARIRRRHERKQRKLERENRRYLGE